MYRTLLDLLDLHQARYRLIDHPAEGRTDLASVLRGHPLEQAAKCIIVRVSITKRVGKYVLAVVPGDRQVDLAAVAALFGGGRTAFATPEIAERLAGSVCGTVMPLSFHPDLHLVVDEGLALTEEIYFNAARLDRSVALSTSDYLAIAKPVLAAIATAGDRVLTNSAR
ncbi:MULTISPECIES: YbaK/EbsC family protein [unclassified Streptomyces]|uniref:YbaK/EbsC family protein n=1 Tax=unclassified Streptomyces TaxID=2593676 RepID=UPI00044EE886|nr:YbaK/EbsC family protein [Streptomyces sp. PCS3-D2]WKV73018.1 YbaK/prolyl-tRNA synthetase associated domain-containing protein [Streptomyces sp. PCS3-D2]